MKSSRIAVLAIAVLSLFYSSGSVARKKSPPSVEPPIEATAANMTVVRDTARELAKVHGVSRVLVVYDIDNTLLTSSTALGSDQWYVWQEAMLDSDDPERITKVRKDLKCLLDAQELLYFTRPMKLTDETVIWSVDSLRSEGFTQWVVTSRGPEVSALTFREFGRGGLSFSNFYGDRKTGPEDFQMTGRAGPVSLRMHDGVLFTSGFNKGEALREVLRRTGRSGDFSAIVFADDTPKHLPRMRDAFEKSGIDVRTFLYQAVKGAVDEFNSAGSPSKALAKEQWCKLVDDIPQFERSVSTAILDLAHDDDDGTHHSLSSCIASCK